MLRKKSCSRLELRDLEKTILVLVSNLEIERGKISISSRKIKGKHFIDLCGLQGSGRPSSQQKGRLMRRMMAPRMTLDTISKIIMVLTVWVMVMRGAVFSVQMSFERFRIRTIYLKGNDIVTAEVFHHQVAPGLLRVVSHLPQVAWDWRQKFSFSSRSTRVKVKILVLVSKHEIVRTNSHSCLEAWDRKTEILDLVSRVEMGLLWKQYLFSYFRNLKSTEKTENYLLEVTLASEDGNLAFCHLSLAMSGQKVSFTLSIALARITSASATKNWASAPVRGRKSHQVRSGESKEEKQGVL